MKEKVSAEQIANHLEHFLIYIKSPWRIIWLNLLAGLFRGLGALIGASLVLALIFWLLGLFTNIPLIGDYIIEFKQEINSYIGKTNYKADLNSINQSLQQIENKLGN